MNQGFSPKEFRFGNDGRDKLISGITQLSNAVKSTLGPQGNTVLIESQEHIGGITVTKDGVTVAKSISLLDPVENLAVGRRKTQFIILRLRFGAFLSSQQLTVLVHEI